MNRRELARPQLVQKIAALALAACGAVLMTAATFPALRALSPVAGQPVTALAEMATMAAVVATLAMVHARSGHLLVRAALFAATSCLWLAGLAFFNAGPAITLVGLVGIIACVVSMADERDSSLVGVPASTSLQGRVQHHSG